MGLLGMLCISMCMSVLLFNGQIIGNQSDLQITSDDMPLVAGWNYSPETSIASRPMVITDLDKDNRTELWTFENSTHKYRVYEWSAPDTYSLIFSANTNWNEQEAANFHEIQTLDYNNDGLREVLLASYNLTGTGTYRHFIPYHGTQNDNQIFSWGYDGQTFTPDQNVGLDFDNDGNTEFIVSALGGDCTIHEVTSAIPSYESTLSGSPAVDLVTAGDFDKDGIKDFFTGGNATDSTIRMWEVSGNNAFTQVWSLAAGTRGCSLGTGDSDLDGVNELYINDEAGNNLRVYECSGNNALVFRTQLDTRGGSGCFNVLDTDGNGNIEIIVEVNTSLGYKQIRDYEAVGNDQWISKWNSTDIPGVTGNLFVNDYDKDLHCELITNSWNNTQIYQCTLSNGTYLPPRGLTISINGGAASTKYTNVTLTLAAAGATHMCFSNDSITWSDWENFSTTKAWNLTDSVNAGVKWVYFMARNATGTSRVVFDNINYLTIPAAPTLLPINPSTTYQKSIWLNWTPVQVATNYSVYRELSAIGSVSGLTPIANLSSVVNSYLDRGMNANHTYYYVVTARNSEGESNPSACQSVNVTIPNLFQKLFQLLAQVDPLTKEIISKGIDFISNITGSDTVGFLTANGDVVISRSFNLGEYTSDMGLTLVFAIGLRAHLNLIENRVEFTFATSLNTAFELQKLKFKEPFGIVAKVLKIVDKMGVSIAASLVAELSIKFYFDADDLSFGLMGVCVRINPSIEFTVKLIPLLLNLKPEVKQVVDKIQKPVAKWLKYDFYNIIVTKVQIGVNLVAQFDLVHSKLIADAQLYLNLRAELDLFQKAKVKNPEISVRLEGLVGVHFDSSGSPLLKLCGTLTFIARVNTEEMGALRYAINPILNGFDFAPNKDHAYLIVNLGTGCSGFVTCNPSPASGGPDNDSDYLDDAAEIALGTNLTNPDTDSDGIWDYLEVALGSDPLNPDTDNDTISDGNEYFRTYTNFLSDDTDDDGLLDAEELNFYGTDPCSNDSDMDGLSDYEELLIYETDSWKDDTDADGFADRDELLWYGTDPCFVASIPADTDGDGLYDKDEIEIYQTSPTQSNTGDSDGDQLTNIQEMLLDSNPNSADTDNDGLSDYDEYYTYHTCYGNADSDGDGYTDKEELDAGFDPLDAASHPIMPLWVLIVFIVAAGTLGTIGAVRLRQKRRENKAKTTKPAEEFDWDNNEKK